MSPPLAHSLAQWWLPSWGQPAWLWATAALAIPLLLHLLSRGQRQRVRVGSVRLLSEVASQRIRRLHPSRLLLLAVRCLLLAAVAVALAGPRWPAATTEPAEVWLLVDPALLAARSKVEARSAPEGAVAAFARLDQATAEGWPIHLLAPGLPIVEETDPALPRQPIADLWSLLREADLLAPPATRFEVLALDRLAALRGQRPAFVRAVEWRSIALASAQARPGEVETAAAESSRQPKAEPLHALVAYTGERSDDAGFVIAALESAGLAREQRTGSAVTIERRPLSASPFPSTAVPSAAGHATTGRPADLAFWLGRSPTAGQLDSALRPGGQLVTDSLLPYRRCRRLAVVHLAARSPALQLHRCEEAEVGKVASDAGESVPLWRDALGRPLLEASRGEFSQLHLHSRFHPAWSDWVTRDTFPQWIAELVDAADPASEATPGLVIDDRPAPGQAAPRRLGPQPPNTEGNSEPVDEERSPLPLWATVAVLLCVERWMALR